MNIVLSEKEYCKVSVRCEADAELIANKKQEVVNKFKSLDVPGFRKGRASADAVKMHYKKQIAETLTQELAETAYNDALAQHNIKPFGRPNFSMANIDGSKFVCEFSVHKHPDFELKEYKGFDIPKPADAISEEEFAQKILEDLRVKYGSINPYVETDFVQMGDNVILDYSASLDGVPIEALNASGEVLSVGKTPIPDFDTQLLGMNINDEREFDVLIPENSGNQELAGKRVKFKAKLLMGSKTIPMPLSDDLAKKLGIETIDLLMGEIRATASGRIVELRDNNIYNQISRRLIVGHEFEVPSWLSTSEAQIKAKQAKKNWDEILDAEKEQFIKAAEESIKLSLVLEKVRNDEPDAQLTDEEVFNYAKKNLMKMSDKPDDMLQTIMSNGQLPLLMSHIRDEYTLMFIKKNCNIVE